MAFAVGVPACAPTDRLCPVPTMPVRSHAMFSAPLPAEPAQPAAPPEPPLPPTPVLPPEPPVFCPVWVALSEDGAGPLPSLPMGPQPADIPHARAPMLDTNRPEENRTRCTRCMRET